MAKRVLMLVSDDQGIEQSSFYEANGDTPGLPTTPNIDLLHSGGITYSRFYVNPQCSPTRASYLTGRYPGRTGIGRIVENDTEQPLLRGELTLMELLKEMLGANNVYCWGVGKWHLGNALNGGLDAPGRAGLDYWAGTVRNLPQLFPSHTSWFNFDYMTQGELRHVPNTYTTEWTVDRALEQIRRLGDRRWFGYIPFHAPHQPFHRPPTNMFDTGTWSCPDEEPRNPPGGAEVFEGAPCVPYFKASQEALDFQIGRLLAGIPAEILADTMIIFLSDNGTTAEVLSQESYPAAPPYNGGMYDGNHGKRECYEPGIRCMLAVSGAGVDAPGRVESGLIGAVDLYLTIAEALGCENVADHLRNTRGITIDSISFLPNVLDETAPTTRDYVWCELFGPNGANQGTKVGSRCIMGTALFKLYWRQTTMKGTPLFFNTGEEPKETNNILVAMPELTGPTKTQYDYLYSTALALVRSFPAA